VSAFEQRLQDIVAHAYANAPAFKQIMDSAGVKPANIRTVADLAKIPVTSKDKLVEMQQQNPPFGGWLAVPVNQLQRVYLSPGPLYDPQAFNDEYATLAAQQAFQEIGLQSGDVAINTFLYHMVPAGLWLDEALKLAGVTVVPIGPGNSDLSLMAISSLKINVYVGTPSFLENILGKAAQMGIGPGVIPLKKAFFSAEPYFPTQRQKFEGEYGLRTSQAYGTADLGLIGYEKVGKPGFYLPDNLIVEIADPHTGQVMAEGEPGEIVVTTFNHAYPLIRFGTGDLSVMETDENGVQRLKGLLGRSGEAVKVRGMFLHPNQIKLVMTAFPAVKAVNAVITRDGSHDVLTLLLELAAGQEAINRDELAETLQNTFRDRARLRVDAVEFAAAGSIDPAARVVQDRR